MLLSREQINGLFLFKCVLLRVTLKRHGTAHTATKTRWLKLAVENHGHSRLNATMHVWITPFLIVAFCNDPFNCTIYE